MPSKSELQNLLRKMGGTPESGDSVDETIKKISEVYEPGGGGSGLPEGGSVGQILKKKSSAEGDAEWADENGGNVDYVTFTVNKSPYSCTADKTYQEVKAGLNNGKIYFALVKGEYFANGTSYGRPNVWNLEWISGSDITFYRSIKNPNASDDNHITIEYQRVSLLADGTARAAITNDGYATPKDCVKYLKLLCNDDDTYQDAPTGTFSVESDYSDIYYLFEDVDSRKVTTKLHYGKLNYEPGASPDNTEVYELVSALTTNDGETPVITITFQTISMRNGTPVLKTVTVTDTAYAWDSLENATVTYSEREVYEPGGGGEALVVNITGSGSNYSSDTSPSQIYDAFLDGKQIYAKYGYSIYRLSSCTNGDAYFQTCNVGTDAIGCTQIRVYDYNSNTRVSFLGKNVSTLKHYTFYFVYDSSQNTYSYSGCSGGDETSFLWENSDSVGNACLVVSYSNTSNDPVNETAWVQKQAYAYEVIDGDTLPIARVHFTNLSVPTMMITDYEMVWNLNDTFMELNVTKVPLGGSN